MRALEGLRVLDCTHVTAGAYCSLILADLGADVVKVEPPDGDPLRDIGPFWHDEEKADRSLRFLNFNTNKRSVTLNLKSPEGHAIFLADRKDRVHKALKALRSPVDCLTPLEEFSQLSPRCLKFALVNFHPVNSRGISESILVVAHREHYA